MTQRRNRYLLWGGLAALLLLGLAAAFRPRPIEVDVAEVVRAPMSVTIDEEGETRIRDVFSLLAPVAGDLERIELEPGDYVVGGETVVARLRPAPGFLAFQSQAELAAAARAADAAVTLAAAEAERAAADRELARADLERARGLRTGAVISERQLQLTEIQARAAEAAHAAAVAALDVRRAEAERAHAALIDPSGGAAGPPEAAAVPIRAPVSGRVLRVLRESGGVASAGESLVEIGDPGDLEVVVDLLSNDAVRVREGAEVHIAEWGGDEDLLGRVRVIEPFGFTKISALGVEEQRVNVVIDFDSPADAWRRLGHGYRVETRIETWRAEDAITAPLAALFREGDDWAVFVARDGKAHLQTIAVGHRNATTAEVLGGLAPGDRVILHPSSEVEDGVGVKARLTPSPASTDRPADQEADTPIAQAGGAPSARPNR
jgi:HlyD family secretion protein